MDKKDSVTLTVVGADVTIPASVLADLWIKKVLEESKLGIMSETITCTAPKLKEGEKWVCSIVTPTERRHLILRPGDSDDANWESQQEWAASINGVQPDRLELSLIRKYLPDALQEATYWTREQHASAARSAWSQHYNGTQSYYHELLALRAVAVRSEPF